MIVFDPLGADISIAEVGPEAAFNYRQLLFDLFLLVISSTASWNDINVYRGQQHCGIVEQKSPVSNHDRVIAD